MLLQALRQPFPFDCSTRPNIGKAAFFGIFVFIFLLVFKPFELYEYSARRLLLLCGVYGAITFTCVFLTTNFIPPLFPKAFRESAWTAGKQILFTSSIVFLVGLVNYLVSPMMVQTSLNLKHGLWFQGITLAVGILPISLYTLLKQNRLLKKFSDGAEQIEKKLQEKKEVSKAPSPPIHTPMASKITLTGDYQNEKIELYADDLYFVSSASNYIKIFHLQKEKLVYSIIRCTLKKAEEQVLGHPGFFKCHRAFIINLDKVLHVEGNAQGYRVKLQEHEELIPVSRNLNSEFSDKLLAFRKHPSLVV